MCSGFKPRATEDEGRKGHIGSVTRLVDLFYLGQLFKAFGNN